MKLDRLLLSLLLVVAGIAGSDWNGFRTHPVQAWLVAGALAALGIGFPIACVGFVRRVIDEESSERTRRPS